MIHLVVCRCAEGRRPVPTVRVRDSKTGAVKPYCKTHFIQLYQAGEVDIDQEKYRRILHDLTAKEDDPGIG